MEGDYMIKKFFIFILAVFLVGCNGAKKTVLEDNKQVPTKQFKKENLENNTEKLEQKNIVFKDKNLEKVIREVINKPTGDIFKSDVEEIIEIDLSNNQITDITPLKNLTNLTTLGLSANQIIDITPLKNQTNLSDLYLFENQIIDITPLENLTNLTILNLGCNQITDIVPLKNLTNLTYLELTENQITDISPLKNLIKLNGLYLESNQITDYSPTKSYYKNLTWKDFDLNN